VPQPRVGQVKKGLIRRYMVCQAGAATIPGVTSRGRDTEPRPAPGASGDLGRLLETEERLEGVISAARRDAADVVERARQEAADRLARVPTVVETEAASAEATIAAAAERVCQHLRTEAARTVAGLASLSDRDVIGLAEWVLACAIAGRIDGVGP